jgi:hypothetical protein
MSQRSDTPSTPAETIRAACVNAAVAAYEDAGIRGLCAEGRWEAALAAIRHLDLSSILPLPAGGDDAAATPDSP